MRYADRRDAGRRLARALADVRDRQPVVCALPRGGAPVAAEVAAALGAPLDILGVRKLGAPGNPELAVGAVAEDGTGVVDGTATRRFGMSDDHVRHAVRHAADELRLAAMRHRRGRAPLELRGRVVVLVDDGLATGLTMLAAARAARARGAVEVIAAAPVASADALALLRGEADDVVCPSVPSPLTAVGAWYDDFTAVPDDDVRAVLTDGGIGGPSAPIQVEVPVAGTTLTGRLTHVRSPRGLVVWGHCTESPSGSACSRATASALHEAGFSTLMTDLLAPAERRDVHTAFDVRLLGRRLVDIARWAGADAGTAGLPLGLLGASIGAAAALCAAAELGDDVRAVVSRGGRPDVAGGRLARVEAPTLLVVGAEDREVLELNRRATEVLHCPTRLAVVDGAGHRLESGEATARTAALAAEWFTTFLTAPAPAPLRLVGT